LIASHFDHEKLVQIQFVEYACFRRIDPLIPTHRVNTKSSAAKATLNF